MNRPDQVTLAVTVTVKIDVPTRLPTAMGGRAMTIDEILNLAAMTADNIVESGLASMHPERRPGWYEWASHSCGDPVSRCISVEGTTLMVNREELAKELGDEEAAIREAHDEEGFNTQPRPPFKP